MIGETERRYAGLDVLVNNAGGYEQPVFPDAPLEQWARTCRRIPALNTQSPKPA